MSNEYTPDYSYVKTVFAMNAKTPVSGGHPDILWEERKEQFDRWLETVKAAAWRKGYEDGLWAEMEDEAPANPYA